MTLALRGATLIDGRGDEPISGATVVVEDNRIVSVGGDPPAGAEVIELDGFTLLPGLIDAHTHLGLAIDLQASAVDGMTPLAEVAARIFRNVELALDAGFTTVREVGGLDGGVASAIDAGFLRGPRVLPSGPLLCQTGGHGDFRPQYSILDYAHDHKGTLSHPGLVQATRVCDGPDEVRVAARRAFRHGATQIKVCVSGGVVSITDSLEDSQFTVEELRAAVEEAEARDSYVTAHAHGVAGILNALEAGVACFEHGTLLDEETATALARAGASLVPTMAVTRLLGGDIAQKMNLPAAIVERIAGVEQAMANAMKLAVDAGVTVGSGSDLIGPDQDRRGLELVLHAGVFDPMVAIKQATATNAKIIRREADLGTIEEGKLADLIAVSGDPLSDIELFDDPSRVVLVVKEGRVEKDVRN